MELHQSWVEHGGFGCQIYIGIKEFLGNINAVTCPLNFYAIGLDLLYGKVNEH